MIKKKDVLKLVPEGEGYKPTNELCYFTGQSDPLEDPKTILTQKHISSFVGTPDIWVKVPEVELED